MKYYNYPYPDSDEYVFPIDFFITMLNDNDSMIIEEQKREYGTEFMWCKIYREPVQRGDNECGVWCSNYNPCNGKSGRCTELVNTMTGNGKQIKITSCNGKIKTTKLKES